MSLRNILRVELIRLKDGLHMETAPVNCEPCIEGYGPLRGCDSQRKINNYCWNFLKKKTKPVVVNSKDAVNSKVVVGMWNVSSAGQMASGACSTHHAPSHHRHHRFSSYSTAVILVPSKFKIYLPLGDTKQVFYSSKVYTTLWNHSMFTLWNSIRQRTISCSSLSTTGTIYHSWVHSPQWAETRHRNLGSSRHCVLLHSMKRKWGCFWKGLLTVFHKMMRFDQAIESVTIWLPLRSIRKKLKH